MNPASVAVATMTWVRSPAEEETLARALAQLADLELPVAVGNRSTSAAFTGFLRRLPRFSVATVSEPGLVAQVKASVERAATFGRSFVLYVEPDKEFFFGAPLRDFIRAAPDGPDTGIVLASRSPGSFDTFPPMQRYTESVVNHLTGS